MICTYCGQETITTSYHERGDCDQNALNVRQRELWQAYQLRAFLPHFIPRTSGTLSIFWEDTR